MDSFLQFEKVICSIKREEEEDWTTKLDEMTRMNLSRTTAKE